MVELAATESTTVDSGLMMALHCRFAAVSSKTKGSRAVDLSRMSMLDYCLAVDLMDLQEGSFVELRWRPELAWW